jgi:hypothetical protein
MLSSRMCLKRDEISSLNSFFSSKYRNYIQNKSRKQCIMFTKIYKHEYTNSLHQYQKFKDIKQLFITKY